MKGIFSKTNAPYLVSGALATITLLASGVFAVAPYIGFLAPVAALSVGLPLIIVGAVFSVIAIALSCAAISKNNTIAEKNEVINQKEREILDKNKTIAEKENELDQQNTQISSLKEQLSNKEIDVRNDKNLIDEKGVQTAEKVDEISEKEDSSTSRLAKAAVAGTMATGGMAGGMLGAIVGQSILGVYVDNSKEGEARRKATVDNALGVSQSAFGIVKSSVKYTCSSINSVGNSLKSIMPSADSVRNWIPSLKTVVYIAGGVGSISVAKYAATNGLVATDTLPSEAKDLGNHTLSSNSHHIPVSLQVAMKNNTSEYSKKLDDALESPKNNFGIPQDHPEPQWVKDLYKSETTEEIIDNGTLPNLFSEGSNSDYQCAKPSVTHAEKSSKTKDNPSDFLSRILNKKNLTREVCLTQSSLGVF